MSIFVEKILSPYMSGYNKGFSIQKALLSLIETQKKLLDKKGYGSVSASRSIKGLWYDKLWPFTS